MRIPGRLYVDLRAPKSVVRINRVIVCAERRETHLYEVTDVLQRYSYTVDGKALSARPVSDLDTLEWMGSG